jgi:hypothetical protein
MLNRFLFILPYITLINPGLLNTGNRPSFNKPRGHCLKQLLDLCLKPPNELRLATGPFASGSCIPWFAR